MQTKDLSATKLKKLYKLGDIHPLQLLWRNDDSVWTTCRQNEVINTASQEKWLEKTYNDSTVCFFGVYKDATPIGTTGLTSINRNHRTAEFSLLIAPEYQGEGHSKYALLKILSYGFLRLDLEVIYGEAIENNSKAIGCYQDFGFFKEGVLRSRYYKMGKRYDSVIFSMNKMEFINKYGELVS